MRDNTENTNQTKHSCSTRYNSQWDWSTWLIILLSAAAFTWPVFIDDDPTWQIAMAISGIVFLAIIVVTFKGIYYRINGENLVIYQFFRPTSLPIAKIESIKPTSSFLSAPATSLTHRLAIKFSDRSVLKSSMPIIISPVRQKEFIAQLLSINPNIMS